MIQNPLDQAALTPTSGGAAIIYLTLYLVMIVLAWYALGSVRWDVFVRDYKGRQASLLRVILSIVLGYLVGEFFRSYLEATQLLQHL